MRIEPGVERILNSALEGKAPSPQECVHLLDQAEGSLEAALLKATADTVSRKRFSNEAILLGQIGVAVSPCPGQCKFCAFGESHTRFQPSSLSFAEISVRVRAFAAAGDLYAIFLMTMHEFDPAPLLSTIEGLRREIPAQTQIVLNVGDFDAALARELKAAGANGAYHILRLREGVDTNIEPARRRKTVAAMREAALDFYYCCEPIGPEHSSQELVEQIFFGIEQGCFQHAAMRRVHVPGTPLASRGQITERRLAQIVAVVTLASLQCPELRSIAVHEPNQMGLTAGANTIYAETGANPRDTAEDTSTQRGLDMAACRKMLYEAGFSQLLRGDGTTIPLTLEYVL